MCRGLCMKRADILYSIVIISSQIQCISARTLSLTNKCVTLQLLRPYTVMDHNISAAVAKRTKYIKRCFQKKIKIINHIWEIWSVSLSHLRGMSEVIFIWGEDLRTRPRREFLCLNVLFHIWRDRRKGYT